MQIINFYSKNRKAFEHVRERVLRCVCVCDE